MGFRVHDEDFIDYIKNRKSVSVQEIRENFGEDAELLLNNHSEGGYIEIKNGLVYYTGDTYFVHT